MKRIDLNADVGEGYGAWTMADDAALFESITSANVATGAHAGDATIMSKTCAAATHRGIVVGAHPSYRDRAGFGRNFVDIPSELLRVEIIGQLGTLDALARAEGTRIRYVKPHGALYNAVVHHRGHAEALVNAVAIFDRNLPIVVPPQALAAKLAGEAGLRPVIEGFIDRAYAQDGTLLPRSEPGSVITDRDQAVKQALTLTEGYVVTIDGGRISFDPETLCLHGDTPGSARMAAHVRKALEQEGIEVTSFINS